MERPVIRHHDRKLHHNAGKTHRASYLSLSLHKDTENKLNKLYMEFHGHYIWQIYQIGEELNSSNIQYTNTSPLEFCLEDRL